MVLSVSSQKKQAAANTLANSGNRKKKRRKNARESVWADPTGTRDKVRRLRPRQRSGWRWSSVEARQEEEDEKGWLELEWQAEDGRG